MRAARMVSAVAAAALRPACRRSRAGAAMTTLLHSTDTTRRCFATSSGGDDKDGIDFKHEDSTHTPPANQETAHDTPARGSSQDTHSRSFAGWKRYEAPSMPADETTQDSVGAAASTSPPPTPPLSSTARFPSQPSSPSEAASEVMTQRQRDAEARRKAASARLADMFTDSARHSQWMQDQQQTRAQKPGAAVYREETDSTRLVRSPYSAVASASATGRTLRQQLAFDEDELAAGSSSSKSKMGEDGSASDAMHAALVTTTAQDTLEQELLDDNFLYYPPAVATPAEAVDAEASTRSHARRYVPGQQVIPPGLTRYRVDVQYQGSDFDGWYKSVQRTCIRDDGSTASLTPAHGGLTDHGAGTRHFARVVLEEALAVALDVPSVSVVAAAIPETGVSVRRLSCHVDVPSEVELQPRTILQRAALWLHQRKQPIAILSCHPCRNQDFHARHSGVRRVYCYRILNRIAPPLFDAGLQWHVDRYLDVPRMQRMSRAMEGTHDFGFFADPKMANALRRAAAGAPPSSTASRSGGGGPIITSAYSAEHEPLTSHGLARGAAPAAPKVSVERGLSQLDRAAALPTFNELGQSVVTFQAKPREYHKARTNLPTIRTLDKVEVVRQEDEVLIWFVGQSFLRHQIRNMVGVLKAAGHGLWDDQELQHAFQSGFEVSRKKFARERLPAAPVHGLTLWDVEYPAQHRSDFVSFVDAGPYEPYDISAQH